MSVPEMRLLLVEDNPVDAKLLMARLERHGDIHFVVTHCTTLAVALTRLAEAPFDVAALDLGLPDSEGVRAVEAVANARPELAIVVLTGEEADATARAALHAGAEDYLVKGRYEPALLARTLRYAVERKRAASERQCMEVQLQHALKLESLGQLAAGVAHEINTPIQFIGDNTRFVRDSYGDLQLALGAFHELLEAARDVGGLEAVVAKVDEAVVKVDLEYLDEELPKALDQSLDGVQRVASIVKAMKQFSHPSCGERRLVNLNDALETALTISRNEWKYVAEVRCEFDPALPSVWCLQGELNQVFLNLIVNAAHAIAAKAEAGASTSGVITITTRTQEDAAEVLIADTGGGIPAAFRGRVFDPFFTTKEPGKGTGQGLAIAFNVVAKQHGGSIDFTSEPGVGTTFSVRLPLEASTPAGVC